MVPITTDSSVADRPMTRLLKIYSRQTSAVASTSNQRIDKDGIG